MRRKISVIFLLTFSLVTLTSCGEQFNDGFSSIVNKIWPNIWVTLAQLIAFVLMCLTVFFFAYKPIKKVIKNRQDYIEQNIKDSKDQLENAKNKSIEAEEKLLEANKDSINIINNAKDSAVQNQERILKETDEILKIKHEQFKKDLVEERRKMSEEIHNEIVSTAIDVSKEILKEEIDENKNEKIINDFLDKISKE